MADTLELALLAGKPAEYQLSPLFPASAIECSPACAVESKTPPIDVAVLAVEPRLAP